MNAFNYKNNFGDCTRVDDVKKIYSYLNDIGKVNVNSKELENKYSEFSKKHYDSNWVNLQDDVMEDFAEWLSKEEV